MLPKFFTFFLLNLLKSLIKLYTFLYYFLIMNNETQSQIVILIIIIIIIKYFELEKALITSYLTFLKSSCIAFRVLYIRYV